MDDELRVWLAGMALSGLIAQKGIDDAQWRPDWAAEEALGYADGVLEELAKSGALRSKDRDLFAIHAHIEDVKLAEDQLAEDIGAAGMLDVDPLTLRIKARYAVADRMLRVRGES